LIRFWAGAAQKQVSKPPHPANTNTNAAKSAQVLVCANKTTIFAKEKHAVGSGSSTVNVSTIGLVFNLCIAARNLEAFRKRAISNKNT
jgi:hypothetical protein